MAPPHAGREINLRITTRTPPVRIAAADMLAISMLPAEHAGLIIKWGMRLYAGEAVSIEDAREEAAMDDRAWTVFMQGAASLLRRQDFQDGQIVVEAFLRASEHQAKVSASKVRAVRAVSTAARIASGSKVVAMAPVATVASVNVPVVTPIERSVNGNMWDGIASALVSYGAEEAESIEATAKWRELYSCQDVLEAIHAISGRRIAKPIRYIETVLTNQATSRRGVMPTEIRLANGSTLLPRPVKRRIQVPPRSGWSFEGWTARGHFKGGATVEDRREVWRNDSGTLSYRRPDPESNRSVPTYEEDPGVYEAD